MAGYLDRRPGASVPEGISELGRTPHKFLIHLRKHVPIETLLADRSEQARLVHILDTRFTKTPDHPATRDIPHNPYPVLALQHEHRRGILYNYQPFMLQDQKFYYYFPTGLPTETVSQYLRPEDLVPSGKFQVTAALRERAMQNLGMNEATFWQAIANNDSRVNQYVEEIPFQNVISRVPTTGGSGEVFNYTTGEWESNGDKWNPGWKRKALEQAKVTFGSVRRRK